MTSKTVEQLRPSQIRRKAIRFVRYPKVSLVLPFLLEVSVTNVLCLDSEPPARGDGRPQSQPPSSVTVGQPAVAPTRASFRAIILAAWGAVSWAMEVQVVGQAV